MTLRDVIHDAIARAFSAGAQWCHVHRHGHDSAAMGREMGKWADDPAYKYLLRDQQRRAADVIPLAMLDVARETVRQGTLFGE